MSDDNYSSGWKILMNEYEDKRSLIQSHLESFVCFPAMKSENPVDLKRLRDAVTTARIALANLGSPVKHWDQIIVFIISLKFNPKTWRMEQKPWKIEKNTRRMKKCIWNDFLIFSDSRIFRYYESIVSKRCVSSFALLLIAYRFPLASIVPDLTIWQHVKTFSQSQSCNAMHLLRRSKCFNLLQLPAAGSLYVEMVEPMVINIVHIIACIIRCCTL